MSFGSRGPELAWAQAHRGPSVRAANSRTFCTQALAQHCCQPAGTHIQGYLAVGELPKQKLDTLQVLVVKLVCKRGRSCYPLAPPAGGATSLEAEPARIMLSRSCPDNQQRQLASLGPGAASKVGPGRKLAAGIYTRQGAGRRPAQATRFPWGWC